MSAPRELKPRPLSVSLSRFSSAVVIAAAMFGAARGATLNWDPDAVGGNNSASGAGLGGSGTWDNLTTSNWWSGGASDTTWNNAGLDTAVFRRAAGTVTLGVPITAGNLIFNTSDFVLAGSPLTLGAGAIVNLDDRSGNAVNTTISSQLAGSGMTLNGNGGTLTLNFAGTHAPTGTLNLRSGTLQVNGGGVSASVLAAGTGVTFRGSSAFVLDNVSAIAATTYNLGALTHLGGDGAVRIERTESQDVQLTFSSLGVRAEGATGLFQADGNFGVGDQASLTSNAKISLTGVGTGVMLGSFARSEGTLTGIAYYDAGGFVRTIDYGGDPSVFRSSGPAQQFIGTLHTEMTGTLSQPAVTIPSLSINGNGPLTLTGLLTVTSAGGGPGVILKVKDSAATISGTGVTASAGRELIIRPDSAADILTISAPITNTTGAVTKSGDGTLILSSASNAFTGTTYVNGGKLTIRGAGAAGAGTEVVLGGGTYELLGYGANDNTVQTIATGKNVTVTGTGTLAAGRLTPATDPATNKTLSFGNLTIGNQILTADPAVYAAGANPPFAGAYALSFTGTTLFTDTLRSTFNVTGTQAFGTAPGLTLGGVVSSSSPIGFIKRGPGTLALTNAGNTFGGAGAGITLQEGVLSITSDGALGNAANTLLLNAGNPTDALSTTGTFAIPRSITLAQVLNTIEVNAGTLTLTGIVASSLPADLVKRGAGKLILTNPGNSFGGSGSVIDLQAGILESTTSGVLGNTANTLQLNGGSFAATESFSAPQNFLLAQAANSIDVAATKTLTLNGLISSTNSIANLTKTGAGNLTLTNPSNSFGGVGSTLDIQGGGTLEATSGGALGDPANSVKLSGGFVGNGTSTASQNFVLDQGNGATATLTVPGANTFTLAGIVSNNGTNTVSLNKIGTGTLELTNVNTFGGAGRTITVTAGTLAAETDLSLGAAGNAITLSGGGFRAIGTFTTTRPFTLSNATNAIDVSQGNTLTISSAFAVAPLANALIKGDLGTLALTVTQPTWTGQITVNAGAIRASGAAVNILGATTPAATANTVINSIGGLELTGGVTVAEPLTINTPGDNTTMVGSNFGGVLRAVVTPAGAVSTYTGAIKVNGAVTDNTFRSIVIGSDSGATFTLSNTSTIDFDNFAAGTGRAVNLILTGASNNANTLSSAITRTAGTKLNLVKTGAGNWILQPPSGTSQVDGLVVRSGTLQNNANAAGTITATLTFTGSSTFRQDNVGSFGHLTKNLGALTFSAGDGVVRNERSSNFNSFLTFASLAARQTGATGLFFVNGNTAAFATNAKLAFTAGATANTFLGPGYFAQANATATGFAWYDTANFVRTVNYAGDTNAVTTATGPLTAGRYMQTTGAAVINVAASTTVLSLHMAGTNALTVGAGQVLTINSGGSAGGLLKTGAVAGTIGGTGALSAGGVGNELIIRTDLGTDSLAISIPITNTGALTKSGLGTLTLSGTQSWSGGTFVNGGTLVAQGPGALGGSAVLALSGGRLNFQADGDGRSRREDIATGKDVTVDGANSELLLGKLTPTGQARNKTVTFGNLSIASQTLLITPSDGFGVRFTGATSFTEALPPTFDVAGTQEGNEVTGLSLAGVVSSVGSVGLVKAGTGTLLLENAGNTFGGLGGLLDIQGGVLAAASNGALGNLGNNVLLNATSASFRATGTFATNRTFTLNQTANQFEVTQGNLLTLNEGLNFGGATASTNALTKLGAGVLELDGNSPASWAGPVTISAGALRLKAPAALGGTTRIGAVVTITNPGAALQLAGADAVYSAYPLALSNSGINTGGALENISGNNLWTGAISVTADNTVIGSSGGTLRLSGGIASSTTTARSLFLAGAGNISLITAPLAATLGAVTKIGSGKATLAVASPAWVGNLVVNAGTFALSGAGRTGDTGTIRLNPGGTLTIDDSGTPITNRLAVRPIIFAGGTLNLIGSGSGNTSESLALGTTNFARGASTITVTAGVGRQAVLNFNGAFDNVASGQNSTTNPPTAASVLFRATNLGQPLVGTSGTGAATIHPLLLNVAGITLSNSGNAIATFNGQTGARNTVTKGILPWALVDNDVTNGVGTSFATFDNTTNPLDGANNRVPGLNPIRALNSNEQTTAITANANLSLVSPISLLATTNFNSLTLRAGGSVAASALFQITLSSGGILAQAGNLGISGGILNAPAASSPLNVWTPGAGTSLTITSTLNGGNGATAPGLIKAGAGLLILSGPQSTAIAGLSANSFNSQTVINQGTLRLASGNNTLFANNQVVVGSGGTLDLGGNSQWTQSLFTDSAVAGGGGVVTSSSGTGTLVVNYENAARNWAGSIQGPVAFSRSGQSTATFYSNQTYTGVTQINGGTTVLRDAAALSGTSSVDVNFATLNLDSGNAGTMDSANRLNDAAPVTLSGGGFILSGRPQIETTETIGDLTIARGLSTITANASSGVAALGTYSAGLTIGDGVGASLTRQAGGVVNFVGQTNAVIGALGLIGSGPRILFTNAPTLTNGIIGPWAIVTTTASVPEFASYLPNMGIGALNAVGFAQYDGTAIPGSDQPTQNIRATAAATVSVARTINSLNLVGFGMTFPSDARLTLASGGLIHSGASASIGAVTVGQRGQLTAGTSATPSDLVIYNANAGTASTLTVNSKIVDNGAGGPVTLVISGAGTTSVVTLAAQTSNTHTGGTIVNGGLAVNTTGAAAATVVFPAGGLTLNGGSVTTTLGGQIAPANVVTLNGPSTLTLASDNTLAGLVFNNTGGTANPVVNTGGTLTLSGPVTATSSNVTTTSLVAGRLALPAGTTTFAVSPVLFNGVQVAPTLASLVVQGVGDSTGGITKTGNGVLQFNAQSLFSGLVDVQGGGLQFATATNGGLSGARFASLNLAAGTRVNLNTGSGIFGSLSGSGVITNSSAAGQTLTVGFNGASTTFSGKFARFGDGNTDLVSLTKIGAGTLTLTGAGSDSTGTLSIQGGGVTFSGAADTRFSTNTVLSTGTLTLDNAGTNKNNRLGGVGDSTTTLSINGGTVRIIGNSAANTTETVDTFTVGSGAGVLDLQPNLSRMLSVRVTTAFSGLQAGGTLFIKNLPTLPDAEYSPTNGEATILLPSAANSLNAPAGFGSGFPSTELPVRPDIVVAVGSGSATAFATKDTFNNLLRPLAPLGALDPEVSGMLLSGALTPTNYDLSTVANIRENTAGYSLVLQNLGGVLGQTPAPLGQYGPNATLLTQTIISGGILAIDGGTSSITTGLLNTGTNVPLTFHAYGNLAVNANVAAGTGGLTKAGGGTLTLTGRGFYTGVTAVNAGTLILDGPQDNSIAVVTGATTGLTSALTVNGGTINLNDHSQAFGTISNNNGNTGVGGVVTNAGATTVTLTSSTATNSTFSGQITGNLEFEKTGAGTLTLSSPSTYTGSTTLRGGGITLRDLGALSGTSSVELNYGALTIDHTQLNPSGNLSPVRIPNVPVSMFGGTLQLLAGGAAGYTATINNTVTLLGGANTINTQIPANSGSSATLTLGSIDHTGATATINFNSTNATLGTTGFNSRTLFTAGTPATFANNLIGAWATVGGADFASYNVTNGVGGLSTAGFAGYTATTLTAPGASTNNITLAASSTLAANTEANVIRVTGTLTLTINAGITLTLGDAGGSGGLLNSATTTSATIGAAVGTGAVTSAGSELFLIANANLGATPQTFSTTLVNSVIKDNGTPVTLVKSGTGIVNLTANNTYTGGTVVNQGTLLLSNATATGAPGAVAVPGDLLINNATTTLAFANQLRTNASVTIDGSGVLNLLGTNTVGRVTFNNRGGNAAPVIRAVPVAVTTPLTPLTSSNLILATGGLATPSITSTNEVLSTTPTLAATSLRFTNAVPVISTSGPAPTSLLVTAPIHLAGGVIDKRGAGSVALNPNTALTATTTPLSDILSDFTTTAGLALGMSVSGPNIPAGALIEAILPGGANIRISLATGTAASANNNITFSGSTYTNGFRVSEGTLILGANSVLDPALPLTPTVINGPVGKGTLTLANNASLMSDNTIRTLHNPVSVEGNFTFGPAAGSTATALAGSGVILAGPMTLSPGAHSIEVKGPLNISTISGLITGGNNTLTKTGDGTLVLSGIGNNWGGSLAVNGGVLRNGDEGAIPEGIDLSVAAGAIFDTPGINQTVKTLVGAGGVTSSTIQTAATLFVGGTSPTDTTTVANSTFAGSIAGIVGDTPARLGLTKVGAGTFILSGANTYRGNTNVNSGTLIVAGISGRLDIASTFSVNNGATAQIDGLVTADDAGSVQTSGIGSRLRGSGSFASDTTIRVGGILEPLVSGTDKMTFQGSSLLEFTDGSTLLYSASQANLNRVRITGNTADVKLPTGTGWTLKLQNTNIVSPQGMKFVLFDGDDAGNLLNANTGLTDLIGNPTIDFGTTGWSINTSLPLEDRGIHFDTMTNDIVLLGVVPEPGSGTMLMGGLCVALGLQRFRRRRS